jgi:hypothetical protein
MDLIITKEQLEQQLGFKIQDFKLEPLYNGKNCIGLSVQVVPVQSIDKIEITGIIKDIE